MKRGYMVGFALIALCAATALFSLRGAATPNVDFARAEQSRDTVQIYGRMVRGSVAMNSSMTRVTFQLTEDRTGRKLSLLYDNPGMAVPANIRNAAQVRVIGTYDSSSRVFHAEQLYTKCPSKYDSGTYKTQSGGVPGEGKPEGSGVE
jgi:cytochrome c-type biogenesis protein CcmE